MPPVAVPSVPEVDPALQPDGVTTKATEVVRQQKKGAQNITVAVRVRPLNEKEKEEEREWMEDNPYDDPATWAVDGCKPNPSLSPNATLPPKPKPQSSIPTLKFYPYPNLDPKIISIKPSQSYHNP